ncbi:uncharacterized protein LOC121415096 [Lytechinus variegatus]|uniref:uncharacterized protein LOC121415096 n=1 Tax=Lytechinus variegatus TaxID=7654 RepID=UPI001BB191B4|nr:uncharacterized protein LOC121415096 [Lytechinus variegatus]
MNQENRQVNLNEEQVHQMAEFVGEHREALFGKAGHCSLRVQQRKERAWSQLLHEMEAQGLPKGRTWKDLRTSWNSWSSKAKKYWLQRMATGGGPVKFNKKYEEVLAALAPQALDGFCGMEGETSVEADLPLTESQNDAAAALLMNMMEEEEEIAQREEIPQGATGGEQQPETFPQTSHQASLISFHERFLEEDQKVEALQGILMVLKEIRDKLH